MKTFPGFAGCLVSARIEELYVRGLLLNLIEKMFAKSKNSTLIAVVLSAVIFGVGHIFGVLNQSLLVIVSKVVWTVGMGMFFGIVYKKTSNLWLPIIIHFLINVCALKKREIPVCQGEMQQKNKNLRLVGKASDKEGYIINEAMKFANREELREWLREHCLSNDGIWLLFFSAQKE